MAELRPRTALRAGAAILAVSAVVQIVLVFTTAGQPFDLRSYQLVDGYAHTDLLHLYTAATPSNGDVYWPYPPGFLPVVVVTGWIARATGLSYPHVMRLELTAGALLLAAAVWWFLRTWLDERRALIGLALVALGPSVVLVGANYGQLDAITWLPAVVALAVWQRDRGERRAIVAGLLIGVSIAVKTVPGIVLLALIPSARNRREVRNLLVTGIGLPVLTVLPFLAADPTGTRRALGYHGLPGFGGLSLLVQPSYVRGWLREDIVFHRSALSSHVQSAATVLIGVAVLVTFVILLRRRAQPPEAVLALLLAFYALAANVTPNYGVWACVLLVVVGRLGWAALVEAWLFLPTLMVNTALHFHFGWPLWTVYGLYVPLMLGLSLLALVLWLREIRPRRSAAPAAAAT